MNIPIEGLHGTPMLTVLIKRILDDSSRWPSSDVNGFQFS